MKNILIWIVSLLTFMNTVNAQEQYPTISSELIKNEIDYQNAIKGEIKIAKIKIQNAQAYFTIETNTEWYYEKKIIFNHLENVKTGDKIKPRWWNKTDSVFIQIPQGEYYLILEKFEDRINPWTLDFDIKFKKYGIWYLEEWYDPFESGGGGIIDPTLDTTEFLPERIGSFSVDAISSFHINNVELNYNNSYGGFDIVAHIYYEWFLSDWDDHNFQFNFDSASAFCNWNIVRISKWFALWKCRIGASLEYFPKWETKLNFSYNKKVWSKNVNIQTKEVIYNNTFLNSCDYSAYQHTYYCDYWGITWINKEDTENLDNKLFIYSKEIKNKNLLKKIQKINYSSLNTELLLWIYSKIKQIEWDFEKNKQFKKALNILEIYIIKELLSRKEF